MTTRKLEFSRGEELAGKYEVVDLLDESPLGLTYRVKHLKTGKYVRLLLLRPSIAGREQKDAIIGAFKSGRKNQHPNLMKLGELGEHEGLAYITMEDFEGSTLRELLQEYKISGKQFGLREAAQVILQILEGLQAAHEDDRIFRALRPEYVLVKVRYTGPRRQTFVAQVKLLGGAFWDLVPAAVLTEDEFTRGEAQYIAPELKSFEPVPTPRTDVYSTGVIFYEMLVGTAPVGTFQLPKARRPDLPNHINDVIELALAQAPEDRYQTAQDCINDIQRTFQASHQTTTNSNKHNIAWTWWAVGLVLVGLVGVILFNLRPEPEKEALAKDSQVRAEVYDNHRKVNPQDILKVQEPFPNMVYVPSGQYVAGRLHQEFNARNSEPLAQVIEVDAFLIDALEFPNLKGKAPKHGVTHKDAEGLCKEAGKRLCTEYEWEKACKGPQNRIYSYGDTFDQDFCGQGLDEAYPAGTKPDCKSGWRTFDQSGNFREWTATAPAGQASRRVVKGGLRSNAEKGTRCAYSHTESAAYRDTSISFRCCLDAPKN